MTALMLALASAACALRLPAPRGLAMVPRPAARVLMSEPDVPTPGGFKDTVNRLKADFQSGKDAAAAYMSGSTPQSEAADPTAGGAVAAALLAALQVEVAQFVLVFSGAWLFGIGVPAAAAAPATGVRLHAAALAALACWTAYPPEHRAYVVLDAPELSLRELGRVPAREGRDVLGASASSARRGSARERERERGCRALRTRARTRRARASRPRAAARPPRRRRRPRARPSPRGTRSRGRRRRSRSRASGARRRAS